ncbi:e3 ubiquitin-protein ligase trim56-like [Anaeramoeba ignava]|uniref:E3 ubiquitin-protein ligase trim56-like n=1 Tax=Anaeramoeba ignava TaxID=1746090 RepID=A0A9Q0LBQ4_ANAIG|nr:e3 ubiquitin-protein ligase trim56-like [Anaeramoeba ignava]
MDNNNNDNNQIENANQNENENEMKNLEKKVTKNLIKDYSNLLNGNSFKDFSIFVENKSNPFEIKVHKSILSSRSPFFNESLRQESLSISLNQFNKKEMESILSYIYYGNISFENQENLIQLMEISIYFKLNLLKEIIQKKILNSINYSNFFQFLFQNRNLNSNEIEIKCFELINQNFSQIQNNENLFNLTKEEIIKFIQFKQEKKEIFQFDFFQFLDNWIKKRNQRLNLKKYEHKMNAKKRLFHSFFSLFDKDSISKQDFDKLKQFDIFLPNSFLIHFERTIFEIQDQENQTKIKEKEKKIQENEKKIQENDKQIKENEKKIQRRDKRIKEKDKKIKSFESENKKKEKENQNLKSEFEKEIEKKEKENENKEKEKKEIQEKLKKEIEKKDKILKQKDEEIQNLKLSFEKEIEKEKQKIKKIQKESNQNQIQNQNQNQNKLLKIFPQFSNSEIITEEEYVKKLQEWINDNDFFSKMKKGFSAKRDGFDCQNWHKAVDNKGKTLVIIKTKDNFIFGGFTQVGWTNDKSKWREEDRNDDDGFIKDSNAFIFSLRNNKGDRKPEKFTIKQEMEKYAIGYHLSYGPVFGSDIRLNSNLQPVCSNFGESYNLPNGIKYETNEAESYLAGSFNKWIVDELETYFI